MKKAFKYGVIGIVGLLLIILVVVPLFISSDQIRQAVEEEVSKAAGMAVTVETLSVGVLPPSLAEVFHESGHFHFGPTQVSAILY